MNIVDFCHIFSVIYSSANKCLLKVAMYSAQMEEYAKALEIYEQVGILFKKLNSLYPTNNVIWSLNCKLVMHDLLHPFIPNSDQNLNSPYSVCALNFNMNGNLFISQACY